MLEADRVELELNGLDSNAEVFLNNSGAEGALFWLTFHKDFVPHMTERIHVSVTWEKDPQTSVTKVVPREDIKPPTESFAHCGKDPRWVVPIKGSYFEGFNVNPPEEVFKITYQFVDHENVMLEFVDDESLPAQHIGHVTVSNGN